MVNTFNKFTTREILGLFIPGLYFTYMMSQELLGDVSPDLGNSEDSFNYLLLFIISISVGCILYIIDLPKRFWFFKEELPTTIIKKKLIEGGETINETNIKIFYYKFYDNEVSERNKSITDRQSTLYHFSANIFLCGVLVLITEIFSSRLSLDNITSLINLAVIIMGITGVFGIFYGKGKMKSLFKRHIAEFLDSEYYTDLKNK